MGYQGVGPQHKGERVSERWHQHFLQMALHCASMSKDPSTQVGAVIVSPEYYVLGTGFNGFPRGVDDTAARYADRETKLKLVVHAELNAILACARHGIRLRGAAMYTACRDVATGRIWGGPPCMRCSVETIQAGITNLIGYPLATAPERWKPGQTEALAILNEGGVHYEELEIP